MPLFFMVLLSGAVSLGAAIFVVYVATHWLPRFDDAASVGMGEVYGVIGISQGGATLNVGRGAQGLPQFFILLCLTVTVQWFLLRRYLRQHP